MLLLHFEIFDRSTAPVWSMVSEQVLCLASALFISEGQFPNEVRRSGQSSLLRGETSCVTMGFDSTTAKQWYHPMYIKRSHNRFSGIS